MNQQLSYLFLLLFSVHSHAAPLLPDSNLTPGEVYTTDAAVACAAHTGNEEDSIRDVPNTEKFQIYHSYGLAGNHTGYCDEVEKGCEIDHLVSAKLGGTNTPKNLWPQSYGGENGAFKKDALEKTLIARVCRTTKQHPVKLPLKEAQEAIRTDWLKAYQKYVVEKQ